MKTLLTLFLTTLLSLGDAIKTDTQIVITIQGVPQADAADFNKSYTVYEDGSIRIPLVGDVKASGKTPAQLARHIEAIYKKEEIYTTPTVNVIYQNDDEVDQKTVTYITEHGSKVIPYMRDMTLQTAIAQAGGAGTFDSKRFAILERNQKTYKYDLQDIKHRNLKIYPNDVIRIPHVNDGLFSIFKRKKD